MPGEYFKKWWDGHRETTLKRRKDRYQEDPEYKERIKARAKADRERLAEARKAEPRVRVRVLRKPVEVERGGQRLPAYGIEILCRAIRRSRWTIYSWERKGWLPRSPLESPRGDKLYTAGMIAAVRTAVEKYEPMGLHRGKHPFEQGATMLAEIEAEWSRLERDGEAGIELDPTTMVRVPSIPAPVVVTVNGEQVEAYSVEYLARVIGRSKYRIAILEQRGVIPETPLRAHGDQWRVYTRAMIEAARDAFESADESEVGARITEEWRRLGVLPR